MKHVKSVFSMILVLGLSAAMTVSADDWTQYLGPNQNGISTETGLMKEWPAEGPKQLWEQEVGLGYSCMTVSNGRLFTMGQPDNQIWAYAFDANTGKQIWKILVNKEEYIGPVNYPGPRSTPTIDGDLAYILGPHGHLLCVKVDSGEVVWEKWLLKDFKATSLKWGFAMSPLVDGDKLVVNVGESKGNSIVIFNKKNGKVLLSALDDMAGYSTPVIATLDGKRQYVFIMGASAMGVEPDTGKKLWDVPFKNQYSVNAASAIIKGDQVFISSGYNLGCAMITVDLDKTPPVQVKMSKIIRAHHATPILIGDHIYGFDEKVFRCIDFSLESQWETKEFDKGTFSIADGMAYILSSDKKGGTMGTLYLAKLSPTGINIVSKKANVLTGGYKKVCWTMPVVANGKIYCRDGGKLVCLDIAAK